MRRTKRRQAKPVSRKIWIPIDPADVPALEQLLVDADPFVTSTIDTQFPYRLGDYVQHKSVSSRELVALLDRNLISRAVSLACGRATSASNSDSDRVAAACMAFLITSGILIEPGISLYELARSGGATVAGLELGDFRIADHIHPQAYVDVALGRANSIDPAILSAARALVAGAAVIRPTPDLGVPLRKWRRHRCAVAQIAFLERAGGTGRSKMHGLIEWSATAGFFDGVAIAFALRFFGRGKRKGMLRGVHSNLPERWSASIDNTAWDLCYVSHWIDSAKKDERIWLLCSNDRSLKIVARASVEGTGKGHFEGNWVPRDAEALYAHYQEASSRVRRDPMRPAVLRDRYERIDTLTESILKRISSLSLSH